MRVAVDPGHGMSNRTQGVYDPGATYETGGVSYEEADITLDYGFSLKNVFQQRGHQVFMTRENNTDQAPVGKRAGNAEEAGCEVFISLHVNSANSQANGLEVLYVESEDLAQKLQDALVAATGLGNRKIKYRDDLAVLKFSGLVALVELGFINSDHDRDFLLIAENRQLICTTIAEVVEKAVSKGV